MVITGSIKYALRLIMIMFMFVLSFSMVLSAENIGSGNSIKDKKINPEENKKNKNSKSEVLIQPEVKNGKGKEGGKDKGKTKGLKGDIDEKSTDPDREDSKHGSGIKRGDNVEIFNITPRQKPSISMFNAMTIDLFVPGGGHFYSGNYILGITFASLKLVSYYSVYYYYKNWQYRQSLYYSARNANGTIDSTHELRFEDPSGGYKTVDDFHKEYDRAAHKITLSIIAISSVYITSFLMLYYNVHEYNEDSIPTFDLQYSHVQTGHSSERMIVFRYLKRI